MVWINSYNANAMKYAKMPLIEMLERGEGYSSKYFPKFKGYKDKLEYYRNTGIDQLCRQVWYHNRPLLINDGNAILSMFDQKIKIKGLDYGCGSAPIGYELLKRGAEMDFVDIDGCSGYEFLKWRVRKNNAGRAGWLLGNDYDFVILLDALEHILDCDAVMKDIISRMNSKSMIVTNYFINNDKDNPEHLRMDHSTIQNILKQSRFNSYSFIYGEFIYQNCLWGRNVATSFNTDSDDRLLQPEMQMVP